VSAVGSNEYGTKTEIKNLNSFRAVYRGVQYEIDRQVEALRRGETIVQETRGWNEAKGRTFSQRSKEEAHDYRYFPEPDLVPLDIDEAWIGRIRAAMPELPDAARARLVIDYGLPEYDAGVLTQTRASADFFEEAARLSGDAKAVSNWMMGDFARLLNATGSEITDSKVTAASLASMLALIKNGSISGKMAKGLFEEMFATGADPMKLAKAAGPQISDASALGEIIDGVITDNIDVWKAFCTGDDRKQGFFVGQVMKASKGKANPQEVNRLLREKMKES
jgi:aspartyl-tRNA(Asn)/glutamyl-tRNA(Gln) amidotransferase subunit B